LKTKHLHGYKIAQCKSGHNIHIIRFFYCLTLVFRLVHVQSAALLNVVFFPGMNATTYSNEPIAAISTAIGEAGISVIRISGSGIVEKFASVWKGRSISGMASHTAGFGRIISNGEIVDEVVITLFKAPKSYTGEDVLEISCHGGFLNTRRVYETILSCGFRPAEPGEFTHRAFLNGKMDLTQAEAVADLIHARSEAALRNASRQLEGALGNRLSQFRQSLIDFTALLELELDFSEEDVEFARREQLIAMLSALFSECNKLMDSYETGRLVRDGVKTALVGLPNAGKSTLLNALLDHDRAIVSPIAGTTRDTIEAEWSHRGLRFILVDTAGIRHTEDIIESMGVERSRAAVAAADLVILVLDATDPQQTETAVLQRLELPVAPGTPLLVLNNKTDIAFDSGSGVFNISAKKRLGLEELKDAMWTAATKNVTWDPGAYVLTSSRHFRELTELSTCVKTALFQLESRTSGEFVSLNLRRALHHLSAITGNITNEDILDSVFSRFCIGK
jgi:tRNA modification GTPase